jgi:hypothetical protein
VQSLSELDVDTRYDLARFSHDTRLLRKLANDVDDYVLSGLACNQNTPSDILDTIVVNAPMAIRCDIADNPSTSEKTLMRLAHDASKFVRYLVASSENTSAEILESMVDDDTQMVRDALLDNSNTPEYIKLQIDPDYIAESVVTCSIQPLEDLSDKDISDMASTSADIRLIRRLSKLPQDWLKVDLLHNPNLPEDIIEEYSDDDSATVRMHVALNPNTLVDIIEKLADDEVSEVCAAVAGRSDISQELLDKLSKHPSTIVRNCVAENMNASEDTLERLKKDGSTIVASNARDTLLRIKGYLQY